MYATRRPPDLKRARHWYRRAALKGHDRGLFEYGLMLIQGEGGPKRPAQGRKYLERAAALGQIDALKVLAYALSEGGYSYQPSRSKAKLIKRALQRALTQLRKNAAGNRPLPPTNGCRSRLSDVSLFGDRINGNVLECLRMITWHTARKPCR